MKMRYRQPFHEKLENTVVRGSSDGGGGGGRKGWSSRSDSFVSDHSLQDQIRLFFCRDQDSFDGSRLASLIRYGLLMGFGGVIE
jgi:hypothetical protein